MALDPARRHPLMAITQNGGPLGHAEQAARLCAAGVRWIQLADEGRAARRVARDRARGRGDLPGARGGLHHQRQRGHRPRGRGRRRSSRPDRPRLARGPAAAGPGADSRRHGQLRLGGGEGGRRPAASITSGSGPLRFTRTKKELAPLQGFDGIRALLGSWAASPRGRSAASRWRTCPAARDWAPRARRCAPPCFAGGTVDENVRGLSRGVAPRGLLVHERHAPRSSPESNSPPASSSAPASSARATPCGRAWPPPAPSWSRWRCAACRTDGGDRRHPPAPRAATATGCCRTPRACATPARRSSRRSWRARRWRPTG